MIFIFDGEEESYFSIRTADLIVRDFYVFELIGLLPFQFRLILHHNSFIEKDYDLLKLNFNFFLVTK